MTAAPLGAFVESGPRARGDAASNRALMDRIAAAFDASRSAPWKPVLDFLANLAPGGRLLDLAAGNGRHSLPAAARGLRVVALDVSSVLPRLVAEKARRDGLPVAGVEGDAGRLPFRAGAFDHAIFIAGLHCIEGRPSRVAALRELRRVLSPGGSVLLSVWSRNQQRFAGMLADKAAPDREAGDVTLVWKQGVDNPVPRFFHLYTIEELAGEVADAGFVTVRINPVGITRKEPEDNLFALLRRPA